MAVNDNEKCNPLIQDLSIGHKSFQFSMHDQYVLRRDQ